MLVHVRGEMVARQGADPGRAADGNLACAPWPWRSRSASTPATLAGAHRARRAGAEPPDRRPAPSGVVVVDDTYNANPAGARAALELARQPGATAPARGRDARAWSSSGRASAPRTRPSPRPPPRSASDLVVVGPHQPPRSAARGRPAGGRGTVRAWSATRERGRRRGSAARSATATPSSTRTTCPTTTLEPTAGDPDGEPGTRRAARSPCVFGGPVPRARREHPHRPASGPGAGGRGRDVVGGLLVEDRGLGPRSTPTLEARRLPRRRPARRRAAAARHRRRGGGSQPRAGSGAAGRSSSTWWSICCHGGPGEDGSLQGALDLAGIRLHRPGAWRGPHSGMDKLAFAGGGGGGRAARRCPRVALDRGRRRRPGLPGSLHRQAPFRRIVDRDRGRRRPRDRAWRGSRKPPPRARARWSSRTATTSRTCKVAVRTWPDARAVGHRATAAARRRRPRSSATRDKYVGGEGMATAPRELPAADRRRARAARCVRPPRTVARLAVGAGRGRIDFLEGERAVRQRGQHDPGVAVALPVGRPAVAASSSC